jgi:ABC-type nitrate/sulfonate/bicarbonate transport system permease component
MRGRERRLGLLGVALTLLVWWVLVPPGGLFLPPLSEVVQALADLAANGTLFRDVADSMLRVLTGVAIAAVIAGALVILSALMPPFGLVLSGPVELLRPIPPIAWVPVAIVIFGVGDAPAVAIVALGAFFPVWLSLRQGLTEVHAQHLLAARSLGASRLGCLTDVVLPSMAPFAFHGLRLGVGLGWFCVVAAEMMGAHSGLGYGVQLFSLNLQLTRTYCYLLAIGVAGMALNYVVAAVEGKVCRWHRLAKRDDGTLA